MKIIIFVKRQLQVKKLTILLAKNFSFKVELLSSTYSSLTLNEIDLQVKLFNENTSRGSKADKVYYLGDYTMEQLGLMYCCTASSSLRDCSMKLLPLSIFNIFEMKEV